MPEMQCRVFNLYNIMHKGLEQLVLIYSFKHNHEPQHNDAIEIEEIKSGDIEKSDNDNGYVEEELILVSEDFKVDIQ